MREVLFETLNHALSPDKTVRQFAEQKLKTLEVTNDFGIHLVELIIDGLVPVALRQLCCVILKQYVHSHWSTASEKFNPPETLPQIKNLIRTFLPQGLQDAERRLRAGVASVVAAVAHYDWPEEWPNLFDTLAKALTSADAASVDGAMRVLVEFSHDITDQQIEYVAPILFPECLNIFLHPEVYSLRTRTRAIEVFNTLEGIIHFMNECDKKTAKRLLFIHLPKYGDAFARFLRAPDGTESDSTLKAEVIKATAFLIERFPKQMKRFMPEILPSIWMLLTNTAQQYVKCVVNVDDETEDDRRSVDSDGENISVDKLIYALLELIEVLIQDDSIYVKYVVDAMPDLIYYFLIYMQICEEKVDEWTGNVERFIEDEDEETSMSTVRAASVDLLMTLSEQHPNETSKGLCIAIERHNSEIQTQRQNGSQFWWKIEETWFLALGSVAPSFLEYLTSGEELKFSLNDFMSTSLLRALESNDFVFLQGQALWMASRIAKACPPILLQKLFELCSKGLEPSSSSVLKVSSARAFFNFCDFIKSKEELAYTILPFMRSIMLNLISFGLKGGGGETIMNLSLSTLAACVELNANLDEFCCQKTLAFSTAAMLKYSGDPVIPTHVSTIVKALCGVPACQSQVQLKLLPTIVSILRADSQNLPIRLQAVCLDVLESMVRGSTQPLSSALVQDAFPVAVACMLKADDTHTLQAGRECVRAFVSKSPNEVISWTDGANTTGISLLVQVVCRLLDPSTPEMSATMVGRLIFVLLKKAGAAVAPYLEQILRAVLSKMQHSETSAVHQSLLMVFAHLIHYHLEPVLQFLSSVPAPDGNSALHFVFSMWCDKQKMFFGAYDQKVSSLALCKLLMYALNTNNLVLSKIMVNDEIPLSPNESGYNLRGKTPKSQQTREIPLLVKIYKLILHELNCQLENPALDATAEDENEFEDEESGDEDAQENGMHSTPLRQKKTLNVVGDVLPQILADIANDLEEEDEDETDEDPDVVDDPHATVDLKRELTHFVTEFSKQAYSKEFLQFATQQELDILRRVDVPV